MNQLGLYFGPKDISVVETKDKKIINCISIPLAKLQAVDGQQEKVPDDVKIVQILKDEFRRTKIETSEATIVVSGKDLMIRTFDIPILPANEVDNAVNFEVKKYIPFKIEDLIYDSQIKLDRANKKNQVLFLGIKRDILDKYFSILSQLQLKIEALEYSHFSVLRLAHNLGLKDKGVEALISVDQGASDEVNFIVTDNGFPLFSRDIILPDDASPEQEGSAKPDAGLGLEKLKAELRVSFDFYQRKFPTKDIEKVFIIGPDSYHAELTTFLKEWNLKAQYLEAKKIMDRNAPFSLSAIKAYGGALAKSKKLGLKIDILAARTKVKPVKQATHEHAPQLDLAALYSGISLDFRVIVLAILIAAAPAAYGKYRAMPLEKEIASIEKDRPEVVSVKPTATIQDMTKTSQQYKQKLDNMTKLLKKQLYVTGQLESFAKLVPEGLWLTDLTFRGPTDGKADMQITGIVYLEDNNKEIQTVNTFLSNLKEDKNFNRAFRQINITSVGNMQLEKTTVTNFVIQFIN